MFICGLENEYKLKRLWLDSRRTLRDLRGCVNRITRKTSVGRELPRSGLESKAVESTCKVKGEMPKKGSKKKKWRVQVQRVRKMDGYGVK